MGELNVLGLPEVSDTVPYKEVGKETGFLGTHKAEDFSGSTIILVEGN